MALELKRLAPEGVEAALEKAERYRDLNQPDEADSICRDILAVAPAHGGALRVLGLSLTDRFPTAWTQLFDEAVATFGKLEGEYDRVYYTGIAWERCGKAQLERGEGRNALHSFEHALECFQRCEALAPPGNPDPVLRWNRCVRAVLSHPLLNAAREESETPAFRVDD